MEIWVLFFTHTIEAWGSLYFFDIFLEREKKEGFRKYRFPVYFLMMLAANVVGYWIGMWKIPLFILSYVLLGRMFFKVYWMQIVFFSALNYCMIFLTDFVDILPVKYVDDTGNCASGRGWNLDTFR